MPWLLIKEKKWLQTEIQIVIKANNLSRKEFIGGRPTKDWKDLGERSKRTRLSAHTYLYTWRVVDVAPARGI